jgi:hypothetical protein
MQAIFKIYRASHDPARDTLVLAGKVVKGTVCAGMKVSIDLDSRVAAEFAIDDIETFVDGRACLLALLLATCGRDVVDLLGRCELVGESVLVTGSGHG